MSVNSLKRVWRCVYRCVGFCEYGERVRENIIYRMSYSKWAKMLNYAKG